MSRKEEQRVLRMKLYQLLALDDKWFLKPDTELYNEICEIGEQLNDERYIWRKEKIEKETYLSFVEQGLSYVEIAKRFKISVRTLFLWRKENELI
ncbi:hypothetical protein ACYSNW_14355 [Enterococcus sp. LJL99]